MYVIPNAGFDKASGAVEANSEDVVLYKDFLKGLPEPTAEPQSSSAGSRSKDQEELLKAHPWMQKALSKKQTKAPESDDEQEEEEDKDTTMAADIVAVVMEKLQATRQEFQGLHEGLGQQFEVYMRREYAHRGEAGAGGADCARGEALSIAHEFCRQHSLRMSSTYSFTLCGGQQSAIKLAQEWCRKMQHFYSAFVEQEHARLDWDAVAAALPSDPAFEDFVRTSPHRAVQKRADALTTLMPL